MVKMVSLKCPECDATLSIAEGRKQCFCEFCGAKIIIDDGSTTNVYRDEARIKEAEVREQIRLKELELEVDERKQKRKILKIKIIISIILGIVGLILVAAPYTVDANGTIGLMGLLCFVSIFWIWIAGDISNDKNK